MNVSVASRPGRERIVLDHAGPPLRRWARLAAIFEFFEALASAGGQVLILDRLTVSGNAAATSSNILAHEALYRTGFALSMIAVPFHLAWVLFFHRLLEPVNRDLSRIGVYVIVVGCALQAIAGVFSLGPLLVLQHAVPLAAFSNAQLQALAYALIRLNGAAYNLYLVFFGLWSAIVGWLMFRSAFLPRIFGVLWMIDGIAWMLYLWPPLGTAAFPLIAAASALAELPFPWWLFFAGVNEARWREQAARATA